ncbi:U3 small nucleolar RNA-associated protein [Verticillium alfalfae VaMs.102]|uniref:U3 small nucleolar RNA-associated protein n=1 Tax=Verticillium alfalfae (strain VaMs.102 / ATCC MYA-4576 / FGSC 10136) TaxID=526221 RepID=C9SHS7_VERA1|nr:U3 small nucleolar RNA-associated protein [Verticillium alfalfae VaMs.102]EEY18500.1 U3 small nucleolar RNA-associated protein [Verticillium alfalfae VaMs.102]
MADKQEFEDFSDNSSIAEELDLSDESDQEVDVFNLTKAPVAEKDAEEQELERLVLGSKASFRQNLFSNDSLADFDLLEKERQLQLTKADEPNLEGVDDADLFFVDAAPSAPGQHSTQPKKTEKEAAASAAAPAWEDRAEYAQRLRRQYLALNPLPKWAREAEGRPAKRRRRSSAAASDSSSSSEDDDAEESDSELSAAPLEKLLRDVGRLAGKDDGKKRRLRPEVIDIQRTRPIPDTHKAAVGNLSFHPEYPVLLSSSVASVLFLHHINPTAHPTPNPMLTSVQAKQIDVRRAEFLYPGGYQIFFAGRRKYFHSWDLQSGLVQKTSQIQGHNAEHKSMERFKLSPCGRYMGIVASSRKGGGIINIISVGSRQWIAAARLDSRHGIADFAWWSTGDGLTILGRGGQVGEYSMEERKFLGIWHDEGCIGGIVVALGGHQGPASLGNDRWVAVGSNSGVTNIYDRAELFATNKAGINTIKANPEPTRRFEQLVTPVTVLTFSPDGQLLAFGSQHKKDALKLAHLPSCTVYRNWPTENTPLGRVTCVAFGRKSDLLAVGNDVGKIRLWEIMS